MLRASPWTERLLRVENLFWAWEKAKAAYSFDKTWFDEVELAGFEANLKRNLLEIRSRFATGRYLLDPARPIAFPKRSEGQQPATRQMFWFSVRDQVAWLALVNAIGPSVDRLMPSWSYGDRLYRSVWRLRSQPDGDSSKGTLQIGPYRHSSRHLYRPFKYAWPRYRRHLYLTAIVMARGREASALSPEDQELLEEEQALQTDSVRVPYLSPDHWSDGRSRVYWASVDLQKFFPNTPISLVGGKLLEALRLYRYRGEMDELIESMLKFSIDSSGWSDSDLQDSFGLDAKSRQPFRQIPTGLLVSGFLANTAMLDVDRAVDGQLRTTDPNSRHRIAHFRYVDDHTFLAGEPEDLVDWIERYQALLTEANPAWRINSAKTEPRAVRDCLSVTSEPGGARDLSVIRNAPLDPDFPRPLLSHTLNKISAVAATRFELLDDESQSQFIHDVEMLLLGDFGETEVRPETRASFAASVLARSDLHLRRLATTTWQASHDVQQCQATLSSLQRQLDTFRDGAAPASLTERIYALRGRLPRLQDKERETSTELGGNRSRDKARHFRLILSAVRRFPDKIRLWLTAVRYCGRVGYDGLSDIGKLLRSPDLVAPLTQSYVSAVVAHGTAMEVIRAVRVLADEAADENARRIASEFLEAAATIKADLSPTARWYERRAVAMLTSASWAAAVSLEVSRPADLLAAAAQRIQVPRFRAVRGGHGNPQAVGRQTRRLGRAAVDSSYLAVWLDRSLETWSAKPSVIWPVLAGFVDSSAPGAAAFFGRYPRDVPTNVLVSMATGRVPPFSDNQGWFYEAVAGRSPREQSALRRVSRKARGLAAELIRPLLEQSAPSGFVRLTNWVDWMRSYPGNTKLSLERASDPRLGEWTCLRVLDMVAQKVRSRRKAARPLLHHSTVVIPAAWITLPEIPTGGVSWASWRDALDRGSVRFMQPQVSDERYMGPAWELDSAVPPDWPWIRGLGLLLLGLLNKSFDWPAPWNPDFWQNGRPEVVARAMSRVSCSSITMAILQSTLAARARENVVRRFDMAAEQADADTRFDPPFIASLVDLQMWLARSMRTLERHQMSGRGGRARQLVPVMLKQLTRPEWASFDDQGHE